MKLLFLGTGTSHGIPVIACNCPVCKSTDPKDKRNRCSAYVTTDDNQKILIDCGPEFRIQCLKFNVKQIDAVLLTHAHADHLHGLDDLRVFSAEFSHKPDNPAALKYVKPPIPIYTNSNTIKDVKNRFDYIFRPVKEGGGHAKIELKEAVSTFSLGQTEITPVPMMHGSLPTVGWLLKDKVSNNSIAYLTDLNFISDEAIELIHEKCGTLQHLVIDGLRIKNHSTHFTILEALQASAKIGGKHIWLTHMTHQTSHNDLLDYVKENLKDLPDLLPDGKWKTESVSPAWDGLEIEC